VIFNFPNLRVFLYVSFATPLAQIAVAVPMVAAEVLLLNNVIIINNIN
jgi:hypothetical protein